MQVLPASRLAECRVMCREFILNLKEAPAPKPAGKGVKRSIEQATGATPAPDPAAVTLNSSATAAPDSSAAEAASVPASSAAAPQATVEEATPSAGESDAQGEAADRSGKSVHSANGAQEQPGVAQQAAEAAGSLLQADSDAAQSAVQVCLCNFDANLVLE